jgi:hypothetical protein
MKCERCEHTIANDSPVWCQECHDARITDVQEDCGAHLRGAVPCACRGER